MRKKTHTQENYTHTNIKRNDAIRSKNAASYSFRMSIICKKKREKYFIASRFNYQKFF